MVYGFDALQPYDLHDTAIARNNSSQGFADLQELPAGNLSLTTSGSNRSGQSCSPGLNVSSTQEEAYDIKINFLTLYI